MALNIPNLIVEFLQQNLEQKFTAREIAEWIIETNPDECRQKEIDSKAKRPILQQISAEVNSYRSKIQKKYPGIQTTDDRPQKYYFTESTSRAKSKNALNLEISPTSRVNPLGIKEENLYPMLIESLWKKLQIYSMRIDERRSRNSRKSGGNKWLYPDIVGIEDLSRDWHRETKDCVQEYAANKCKLWSFEVKTQIYRYNVREAFFQAVSNSSWANFGYLVASGIDGSETQKELRMLASLHGIGFIRLDVENPTESEIIIPAKERSEIDWDTANRLVEENKDFLKYIKSIRQFYQIGEIPLANFKDLHSLIEN